MKVLLKNGKVTTVTNEKAAELIASGEGIAYTGEDPEEIAVREALAAPDKPTEKIEVTHRYIVGDEEE